MIKVGETLDELVCKSGKSQSQVAEELGLHRQTINRYIRRDGDHMKLDTFQRVLDHLGYELFIKRKSD